MIVDSNSDEKSAIGMTGDLDDLNNSLYDIGAQDLLDVWESMDVKEEPDDAISTNTINGNGSQNAQNMNSLISLSPPGTGLVLKDRLLTDSVVLEEFPVPVKHEHSYSMGAGSDGDSMPDSPISLQDDMETECYPCIPMQSASNQRNSGAKKTEKNFTIKHEPMDDLDELFECKDQKINGSKAIRVVKSKAANASGGSSSILTTPTVTSGSSLLLRHQQQQHTVHLARPKHPQSLLKQKPVTHTILVTGPGTSLPQSINVTTPPLSSSQTTSKGLHVTRLGHTTVTSIASSGHKLVTTANNNSSHLSTNAVGNRWESGVSLVHSQPKGAPIQTSLISSQPADANGVLILTEEEKKTLISEGYPIPSRLPLTKAEEKSLKKIRRKIKNKISAQESRRKKKEFVDTLERQVELTSAELGEYKKKCQILEKENQNLLSQLKSLKAMISNNNNNGKNGEPLEVKIKEEPQDPDAMLMSDSLGLD